MSIGTLIRQLRRERGLSQQRLAAEAAVDMRRISFYENDKMTPSTEVLVRLAQFFEVSVDYLLAGQPEGIRKMAFQDRELFLLLQQADRFPLKDREVLKEVLRSFVIKNRVKDLSHLSM